MTTKQILHIKNINIGEEIEKKFKQSKLTKTEFARKIGCDRTTVYNIFTNRSIDIVKLIIISDVLHFDFINEIYFKQISTAFSEKVLLAVEVCKKTLPANFMHNDEILVLKNITHSVENHHAN
jgi:transcriptional regulator with XRE-family HTH domain